MKIVLRGAAVSQLRKVTNKEMKTIFPFECLGHPQL